MSDFGTENIEEGFKKIDSKIDSSVYCLWLAGQLESSTGSSPVVSGIDSFISQIFFNSK